MNALLIALIGSMGLVISTAIPAFLATLHPTDIQALLASNTKLIKRLESCESRIQNLETYLWAIGIDPSTIGKS